MGTLTDTIEGVVSGTPFERPARWLYSELSSIGRPRARQSRGYDRLTVQIMSSVLEPSSCCVDAGAHRGGMLLHMAELAPQGQIFAFEPLPDLAGRLRKRWQGSSHVQVFDLALSDSSGTQTFHEVVDSPGKSSFRRMGHVAPGARVREIPVRTARLDDVVPPETRIRFIKVDVEGAQLEVFRGARRILSRDQPFIVFEHGMLAQEGYGTTSDMIYDLLVDECGLEISLLSDWLSRRPCLTRDQLNGHVGHHATSHFCFLAHPV